MNHMRQGRRLARALLAGYALRLSPAMIIETERLILRDLTQDDAQALHPVFADPEGTRFTLRIHSTVRETLEWIERIQSGYRKHGLGPLAVVRKSDNQVIGYCGCGFIILNGQKECEIGYRIARSCWGKGFATEAVQAVIGTVFESLPLSRIVALIQPANIASIRVAEKSGMRYLCNTVYEGEFTRLYEITPNQGTMG